LTVDNPQQLKTAVIVHGYHLYADNWKELVWGHPEIGILGCASKALTIARELNAKLMIWGTGASERDGLKEADYTFNFVQQHATGSMYKTLWEVDHRFNRVSQNTKEEVAVASTLALQEGIERIVLVSNPTHIARCLQTALTHFWGRPEYDLLRRNLTIAVSDVCWANSGPEDVAIFEPPHRGDLPKLQTHVLAKNVIDLSKKGEKFKFFLAEWKGLIAKFGGG